MNRVHPINKKQATEVMQRLAVAMCDADDFDPEDTNAKQRSDEAKIWNEIAERNMEQGDYEGAIKIAKMVMRILEGN